MESSKKAVKKQQKKDEEDLKTKITAKLQEEFEEELVTKYKAQALAKMAKQLNKEASKKAIQSLMEGDVKEAHEKVIEKAPIQKGKQVRRKRISSSAEGTSSPAVPKVTTKQEIVIDLESHSDSGEDGSISSGAEEVIISREVSKKKKTINSQSMSLPKIPVDSNETSYENPTLKEIKGRLMKKEVPVRDSSTEKSQPASRGVARDDTEKPKRIRRTKAQIAIDNAEKEEIMGNSRSAGVNLKENIIGGEQSSIVKPERKRQIVKRDQSNSATSDHSTRTADSSIDHNDRYINSLLGRF